MSYVKFIVNHTFNKWIVLLVLIFKHVHFIDRMWYLLIFPKNAFWYKYTYFSTNVFFMKIYHSSWHLYVPESPTKVFYLFRNIFILGDSGVKEEKTFEKCFGPYRFIRDLQEPRQPPRYYSVNIFTSLFVTDTVLHPLFRACQHNYENMLCYPHILLHSSN